MTWFQVYCAVAVGCSAVYWVATLACTLSFFRRKSAVGAPFSPPVSVLKPLCGYDEDLEENLRALCRQDYPCFQIVFGVEDECDSCVPVVRKIIAEYPEKDLQLIFCGASQSANRKVHNLRILLASARHEILVLADSDVSIGSDCLRQIVAPLAEEKVGLVCCPYRWKAPETIAAALEALTACAEFIPSVLLVERFGGLKFALGATIVVRRQCIDGIGGLEVIQDYLADDYQLGARIHRLGFRLAMSSYVVQLTHHRTPWKRMMQREIRLARTYRVCSPVGFLASVLTHGVTWATLLLWCMHGSPLGWGLWLGTLFVRLTAARVLLSSCFPDEMTNGYLWLLPFRDGLASIWWLMAFSGNKITWRGHTFVLKSDGTLRTVG